MTHPRYQLAANQRQATLCDAFAPLTKDNAVLALRFTLSARRVSRITSECCKHAAPLLLDATALSFAALSCRASLTARAMPSVTTTLLSFCKAVLIALVLSLHRTAQLAGAATIAANTPGLYRNYYNSGFSSTPITSVPNYSALTPTNSTFVYGTTGSFANPQLYSNDTYCGGVYQGYLYTTASYATYLIGVQSKDGFSLTIDGTSISSNSKPVLSTDFDSSQTFAVH